ncbi:unnamed protein product [Prorocentrum cordatum]|uniref:RRM domain-containing protein n=1 Tax=Prorocentrum cordatum TaxID=2364126 RepID=A0ABN9WEL3_9DINO|nr:unnamed protein product [Polarella glacialis]
MVAAFPNFAAAAAATDCDGRSVLALAVVHRQSHLVPLLLARQAQVDAVDADQRTALMLAAQAGDPLAVQHLLAAGASATLRSGDGRTAAELACDRATQRQIQWRCDAQDIGSRLAKSPSLPALSEAEAAAERSRRFRLRVECLPRGADSDVLEDNIRLMLEKRGTPPEYLTVGVDPITQLTRGHVYLDYAERSKARAAANLDGRHVLGCTVRVIEEGPVFV